MKYWMIFLTLALNGCVSESVLEMGDGRYTATGASVKGIPAARQEAVDDAKAKCAESGKNAVIEGFSDIAGDVVARSNSSVTFRCE